MNNTNLHAFVAAIMGMRATTPLLGGSYTAIAGATHPGGDIINNLKKHTLAFATEYQKDIPSAATLKTLSAAIEGSLSLAIAMSLLYEAQAGPLIDSLHTLTDDRVAALQQ
jgi:hypothetical protein